MHNVSFQLGASAGLPSFDLLSIQEDTLRLGGFALREGPPKAHAGSSGPAQRQAAPPTGRVKRDNQNGGHRKIVVLEVGHVQQGA